MEDIYFKQKKLFNPKTDNLKVIIYGAGSIGSHVAIGLAKIGINTIKVIDYDVVETDNFPAQFYDVKSIGSKIDNLQRIIKEMTGTIIEIESIKVDETFEPNIELNTIHLICFDNIEGRKIIFEKLNGFPVHLIDGRIGGFNLEKYYINCMDSNESYSKTLEGTYSELECGEKCLWAVNTMISSKMIADVIKISKGIKPNYMFKGHLMADISISKEVQ